MFKDLSGNPLTIEELTTVEDVGARTSKEQYFNLKLSATKVIAKFDFMIGFSHELADGSTKIDYGTN